MTHIKSRLEFRLSIAKKEPVDMVKQKWEKYMDDYDNLPEPKITDKIHHREAFYSYMNYVCKERKNEV